MEKIHECKTPKWAKDIKIPITGGLLSTSKIDREYKFKVYYLGKIYDVLAIYDNFKRIDIKKDGDIIGFNLEGEGKYKCILMQYTGLKDNTNWEELTKKEQKKWKEDGKTKEEWDGKEIYEDDIISYEGHILCVYFYLGHFTITKFKWENEKLWHEDLWKAINKAPVKVIGNKWENPNLFNKIT